MLGSFGTNISPPCIVAADFGDEARGGIERDPESSHSFIGQLECVSVVEFLQVRDHASPAADNISVSDDGELSVLRTGVGIACNKEFVAD